MKNSLTSKIKRRVAAGSLLLILCSSSIWFQYQIPAAHAEPAYAKWGVIAVKKAETKYGAPVKDYAHMGRTVISESIAEEKFRLLIQKDNKELTVEVTVRFNPQTDELINVDFTAIH
ncbi:DUF3889 domain-containing protein [Paenibacillus sp. GYB006]|uniref:DUF3889 domain-containing protein n=1 Tax=Paenibacillus sp. GYB006 TaxID=2994394 RepID=UPI002F9634B3